MGARELSIAGASLLLFCGPEVYLSSASLIGNGARVKLGGATRVDAGGRFRHGWTLVEPIPNAATFGSSIDSVPVATQRASWPRAGYAVMTGDGPGIMEAANRCAREAGGLSLGCNIRLPMEQKPNLYLDRFIEFEHLPIRKVMLVKYSTASALVVMPGAFGTLDGAFEVITLVQTGKLERFPVIATGGECWDHPRRFGRDTMMREGVIGVEDLELIHRADSPAEAVPIVRGA